MADRLAAPADRRWLILVVVAIAQLMLVLDATIVNIALPSAQQALGFSEQRPAVGGDGVCAGVRQPAAGGRPAGDMFSRKWVFITGLIGFAIASAIGGAAGLVRRPGQRPGRCRARSALSSRRLPWAPWSARSPTRANAGGPSASSARSRPAAAPSGLILGGVLTAVPLVALVPVCQPGVRRDRGGRRPGLDPRRPPGRPAADGLARRRAGLRRAVR